MKIAEDRDDDISKKERSRGEGRHCRRGRDIIEERRAKRESHLSMLGTCS